MANQLQRNEFGRFRSGAGNDPRRNRICNAGHIQFLGCARSYPRRKFPPPTGKFPDPVNARMFVAFVGAIGEATTRAEFAFTGDIVTCRPAYARRRGVVVCYLTVTFSNARALHSLAHKRVLPTCTLNLIVNIVVITRDDTQVVGHVGKEASFPVDLACPLVLY